MPTTLSLLEACERINSSDRAGTGPAFGERDAARVVVVGGPLDIAVGGLR